MSHSIIKRHERLFIVAMAWLLIEVCLLVWQNPLVNLQLAGPTDYLRFAHIFDFLDGQDWYDQTLSRLEQPTDNLITLTRMTDIPLLAIFAPLANYLDRLSAALMTAGIIPAILLAGTALGYGQRGHCRPAWARCLRLWSWPQAQVSCLTCNRGT